MTDRDVIVDRWRERLPGVPETLREIADDLRPDGRHVLAVKLLDLAADDVDQVLAAGLDDALWDPREMYNDLVRQLADALGLDPEQADGGDVLRTARLCRSVMDNGHMRWMREQARRLSKIADVAAGHD